MSLNKLYALHISTSACLILSSKDKGIWHLPLSWILCTSPCHSSKGTGTPLLLLPPYSQMWDLNPCPTQPTTPIDVSLQTQKDQSVGETEARSRLSWKTQKKSGLILVLAVWENKFSLLLFLLSSSSYSNLLQLGPRWRNFKSRKFWPQDISGHSFVSSPARKKNFC